jgi:hypothetical protein
MEVLQFLVTDQETMRTSSKAAIALPDWEPRRLKRTGQNRTATIALLAPGSWIAGLQCQQVRILNNYNTRYAGMSYTLTYVNILRQENNQRALKGRTIAPSYK